ncbi:MAG: LacI family DNA-binding transcriptional regulator, partial [Oscillospiraceae bacterium]|nr:LacI family DNA-binding transcriptional regulator [Oscillospiraceae bacterium]
MTMKELAKLAGVSPSAVSRYLNGGSLSPEKRTVIREAIEKTGY